MFGKARYGLDHGDAGLGVAAHGRARQGVRQGRARSGGAGHGPRFGLDCRGKARRGTARYGMDCGLVGQGTAWILGGPWLQPRPQPPGVRGPVNGRTHTTQAVQRAFLRSPATMDFCGTRPGDYSNKNDGQITTWTGERPMNAQHFPIDPHCINPTIVLNQSCDNRSRSVSF